MILNDEKVQSTESSSIVAGDKFIQSGEKTKPTESSSNVVGEVVVKAVEAAVIDTVVESSSY